MALCAGFTTSIRRKNIVSLELVRRAHTDSSRTQAALDRWPTQAEDTHAEAAEDAQHLLLAAGALVAVEEALALLQTSLPGATTGALLPEALLGAAVEVLAAAADVLLELAPTAPIVTWQGTAWTHAASTRRCSGRKI